MFQTLKQTLTLLKSTKTPFIICTFIVDTTADKENYNFLTGSCCSEIQNDQRHCWQVHVFEGFEKFIETYKHYIVV